MPRTPRTPRQPRGDTGDIPPQFRASLGTDHERREVQIPMRDGVTLHTVILLPAGARRAPMVLERTPYAASRHSRLNASPQLAMALHPIHAELAQAGYIVVLQDVRGKHGSGGRYVMTQPRHPGGTDHATDAWDTIDWLVKHVPEANGRVATMGVSYDGFAALMSLLDPHPALKCCVPINPMVDGWIGDDWFHNGAFRQTVTARYAWIQTTRKGSDLPWPVAGIDEYTLCMAAGSAGELGRRLGLDALPFWQRLTEHPAYDEHWQQQAVDRLLRAKPVPVPTLHVRGQWDAEDSHGPMAAHAAMEAHERPGRRRRNFLVIGPWSHMGAFIDRGDRLGALRFGSDTARSFRQDVMLPFLDAHLRPVTKAHGLTPALSFETGSHRWQRHRQWPPKSRVKRFYTAADGALAEDRAPAGRAEAFDAYVADPAKPVTHQLRPVRPSGAPGSNWDAWLVDDQRFAADRPDVLVWQTPVLTRPLRIAGAPVMRLFASTTGSDADWVVKLIDVYPEEVPGEPALGGYQLPVAMEILRGRYRDDPSRPQPIPPGEVLPYTICLPHVAHAFLPGHRVMVQVQSSWFPLYDRNPQTFVDNIFFASPTDYVRATHRVHRRRGAASCIELPLLG